MKARAPSSILFWLAFCEKMMIIISIYMNAYSMRIYCSVRSQAQCLHITKQFAYYICCGFLGWCFGLFSTCFMHVFAQNKNFTASCAAIKGGNTRIHPIRMLQREKKRRTNTRKSESNNNVLVFSKYCFALSYRMMHIIPRTRTHIVCIQCEYMRRPAFESKRA